MKLGPGRGVGSLPFAQGALLLSWELHRPLARAAIGVLAPRDAAAAGLVSTSAIALTQGVLHTMYFVKLKTAATQLCSPRGALACGAAVWGCQDTCARAGGSPRGRRNR